MLANMGNERRVCVCVCVQIFQNLLRIIISIKVGTKLMSKNIYSNKMFYYSRSLLLIYIREGILSVY